MDLKTVKCVPCEGGVAPFNEEEIKRYLPELKNAWEVVEGKEIRYDFKFADFPAAIEFVNKVAKISQEENHHPDIGIFYTRVQIILSTHSIKGLSLNDFAMAAKIENI